MLPTDKVNFSVSHIEDVVSDTTCPSPQESPRESICSGLSQESLGEIAGRRERFVTEDGFDDHGQIGEAADSYDQINMWQLYCCQPPSICLGSVTTLPAYAPSPYQRGDLGTMCSYAMTGERYLAPAMPQTDEAPMTTYPSEIGLVGSQEEASTTLDACSALAPRNDGKTFMLRHIPGNTSREILVWILEERGFSCCVDFVYLPFDHRKPKSNKGYAFVNVLPEHVDRFLEVFQGFSGFKELFPASAKPNCEVDWAEYQGLQANIERYRNCPVMHEDIPFDQKPLLFQEGVPIPFPAPTKRLKKPWNPAA
jgi:hypothetical protein